MKVWAWLIADGVKVVPGAKKPILGGYYYANEHFLDLKYWRKMGGPKLVPGDKPIRVKITVKEIK